jgi:hypothetical chaperone protein
MIVGMDFGTTNSGMAVYDGRSVTVLPLDPANRNPRVIRTAIYVTNDRSVHIGRAALDHYFEQNIGRPVKMQRVWIGELEVYGADMYYVTDAYVFVDVLSPGRLFLSTKTSLRDSDYPGTIVGQFYYPLEDLIALYMTTTKIRAEKLLGTELREVVLGRPVHFAREPEKDALAQARLLQAAFRAGYEKVYLQKEPIAAAYSYETTLSRPQNVLVFDFGGGTLDLTIIRLGDPSRREVLASGGIPVAGDVFDQRLVRRKLARHFGEGSQYGSRSQPRDIPRWIYDTFSDWQMILELQSRENKRILEEIARTSRRRYQIEQLMALVGGNYALLMFDTAEQAKRRLSESRGAEIRLHGEGFDVREFVTRTEFEGMIRPEIVEIEQHLQEVVAASGLDTAEIDAVIRTGGSAQIPVFYEMLCRHFSPDKVHEVDTFSSVTAGLGVIGHKLAAGEIELPAYTPGMVRPPAEAKLPRPNVSPAQLDLLQRRIQLAEGDTAVSSPTTVEEALVWVAGDGEVVAQADLSGFKQAALANLTGLVGAVRVPLDEPLLLVTNQYRFLRQTARQLLEQQSIRVTLADLYQLNEFERVTTICLWGEALQKEKLLLVTSMGLIRPYPLDIFRSSVEAPIPLKFSRALPGDPVAALGANDNQQVVALTDEGRAARYPVADLSISGTQAINCGATDRVRTATVAGTGEGLLLVTEDGYGRILQPEWLPVPPKPNSKARSQIARRSAAVALCPATNACLITNHRLVALDTANLLREDSTRTELLLKLEEGERVETAVSC